jgi:hypothetical protein
MIYNNRAGDGGTITPPAFNVSRETMTMKILLTSAASAACLTSLVWGLSLWAFVASGGNPSSIQGRFYDADFITLSLMIFTPFCLIIALGMWINQTDHK